MSGKPKTIVPLNRSLASKTFFLTKKLLEESVRRPKTKANNMACPTCSGTMANLNLDQKKYTSTKRGFWCQRCGTTVSETADGHRQMDRTSLAGIVRRILRDKNAKDLRWFNDLAECTFTPEERVDLRDNS